MSDGGDGTWSLEAHSTEGWSIEGWSIEGWSTIEGWSLSHAGVGCWVVSGRW